MAGFFFVSHGLENLAGVIPSVFDRAASTTDGATAKTNRPAFRSHIYEVARSGLAGTFQQVEQLDVYTFYDVLQENRAYLEKINRLNK